MGKGIACAEPVFAATASAVSAAFDGMGVDAGYFWMGKLEGDHFFEAPARFFLDMGA